MTLKQHDYLLELDLASGMKLLGGHSGAPPLATRVEILRIYGLRHIWSFDQLSLIIVDREPAIEWGHSFS